MQRRKSFLILSAILVMLFASSVSAQSASGPKVVASTSWTAAIARAGGARNIAVIAPLELKHPPEYEIKPSDLDAVKGAALMVHSGYEKFATRLLESSGSAGAAELRLITDNVPAVLKAEARKVAEKIGTVPAYLEWERGFDAYSTALRARIAAAYPDKRVAAHRFLKAYAEWLGFEVVGVFGPGEPTPAVVLDLVRAKPALVIDNYHNPSGKAVSESLKVPLVELINFPGKDGTRTIEDVFALNERSFLAAAAR